MSNQHNELRLEQLYQECLDKGMTEEEALEYFEFNVSSAWLGDMTPIWCLDDL